MVGDLCYRSPPSSRRNSDSLPSKEDCCSDCGAGSSRSESSTRWRATGCAPLLIPSVVTCVDDGCPFDPSLRRQDRGADTDMTDFQMDSLPDDGFRPLLEFDLDTTVLNDQWVYCDFMSSFVANMVSHNRADPFMFSNLLSATLNELFETVYRTRKEAGQFRFRMLRKGSVDRITMVVPCGRDEQQFYLKTVEEIRDPGASDKYLELLFSDDELDRRVGLFELAISYKAQMSAVALEDKAVCLTVDLVIEQGTD